MAVTLVDIDLVQPIGQLSNSYFPDGDLDALLGGWLSRATTKVEANTGIAAASQDDAAAAWTYYLAYSHIANRLGAMPNTLSVGSGEVSRAYAADRPAYWLARAEANLAAYAALVVPAVTAAAVTTPRDSMYVPVQVVF